MSLGFLGYSLHILGVNLQVEPFAVSYCKVLLARLMMNWALFWKKPRRSFKEQPTTCSTATAIISLISFVKSSRTKVPRRG